MATPTSVCDDERHTTLKTHNPFGRFNPNRNRPGILSFHYSLLAFFTLTVTSMAQTVAPLSGERASVIKPLIAKVEASINMERWLDAAQAFDQVWQLLDEHEDLLTAGGHVGSGVLEPGETQENAGARDRLRSVARSAPEAFRQAYAEQFDTAAQAKFREAILAGERRQLMSLLRRYEHTPSSGTIRRALTADARARGESTELALLLEQLNATTQDLSPELILELATAWIRAGFPSEARRAILKLTGKMGYGKSLTIGGRVWKLPGTEAEIADWTNQLDPNSVQTPQKLWLSSQGNAAGYLAQARQKPRLQSHWRQTLFQSTSHPEYAAALERLEQFTLSALRDTRIGPAQSLVTDNLVIVQAVGTIQAFDRPTGRLVWESSRFNRQLNSALQRIADSSQQSQRFVVAAQIVANAPQNHVRGQMASDGKLLFSIEETSQGISSPSMSAATTSGNQNFNILRVYDVATGRLRGQIGGLSAIQTSDHQRDLSSVYFLGAPLLLNERVLVLAEDTQGIHLISLRLDSRTGASSDELEFTVADRQLLLVPRYELQSHPLRRFAGITPTFSNGRIICHGCDEHVLAVDVGDLSLQWIHRYRGNVRPKELGNGDPVLGNALTDADSRRRDRLQRPHDSTARVVGNQLVLMPRDSDQVLCLDVRTGRQLWSRPRNHLKYVAGFSDETVVLAGSTGLISLRRTDGEPVWQHVLENASISGQPAATDRLIYLPTDEGQLVVLSLTTGRQLLRQQLTDSPLGNLTSVDRQLLAQTRLSITSWIPVASGEPDSLASIHEALLKEDVSTAIDDLAQLIETTTPGERQPLRQMLADQLLESLRLDFTGNRHFISRLQTLIDDSSVPSLQIAEVLHRTLGMTLLDATELPAQWAEIQAPLAMQDRMEHLVIQGLMTQQDLSTDELITQISGAIRGALTQPERDQRAGQIRRLSANHTAAVINNVLQRLDAAARNQVIDSLQPLVQQIVDTAEDDSLALHQAQFCWMAGLPRCLNREQIFDRLPESNRNPFFHSLLASASTDIQPTAGDFGVWWKTMDADNLESLLQSTDRPSGPLNDAVGQIADQLQMQHPPEIRPLPKVDIGDARTARATPNPTIGSVRTLIPLYGTPGIFRGWQFVRVQNEPGILAIDKTGRRRWTFDYSAIKQATRKPNVLGATRPDQQPGYCVALGQMLAVVEDGDLVMLDGASEEQATPRVVWNLELASVLPNSTNHQGVARAWERTQIYDRQPDGLAPLGPITEFGVPLFRGHRLVVLNPWSGAVMWFEEGLPDDCRLVAQGDRLCLLSAATGQIQVRDMRDGSVIRSAELPAWWEEANLNYDTSVRQIDLERGTVVPWRIAIEGTRCLIFTLTPGESSLQCYDLSQPGNNGPQLAWQVQLAENSIYSNVSDGLVAVLENDDRLQIRQIFDGKMIVDQKVQAAESCERLYLRKSNNRLIVLTHCMNNYEAPFPVIGAVSVNGPIYAFDAVSGKSAWTAVSDQQAIRILNPDAAAMPTSAPMLVLVKRNFPQVPAGGAIRSSFSAQILATENGDVLYEEENVGQSLSYHAMRFEEDGRITVSFEKRSIVFDFDHAEPSP